MEGKTSLYILNVVPRENDKPPRCVSSRQHSPSSRFPCPVPLHSLTTGFFARTPTDLQVSRVPHKGQQELWTKERERKHERESEPRHERNPRMDIGEFVPFVKASTTPHFSRYLRNSSFFVSMDWIQGRTTMSEEVQIVLGVSSEQPCTLTELEAIMKTRTLSSVTLIAGKCHEHVPNAGPKTTTPQDSRTLFVLCPF